MQPKTVRAIHANRGVEAKYRKRLQALIDEMQASYEYWLKATYRNKPPAMAQDDEGPAKSMAAALKDLSKRWVKRFEDYSPILAEQYIQSMRKATDKAFQQALKDAGFAVEFKMTRPMQDALNAMIAENVGLIRSIPQQYHSKVEGIVMRNYAAGRDLQTMTAELQALYPVTRKRAVLIARDQSNKANAVVNRARQLEIGITEAIWLHSHAGKQPRPDHVAANGKRFKVAKGCLISGEYIQPGELINCRCSSRAVLPF